MNIASSYAIVASAAAAVGVTFTPLHLNAEEVVADSLQSVGPWAADGGAKIVDDGDAMTVQIGKNSTLSAGLEESVENIVNLDKIGDSVTVSTKVTLDRLPETTGACFEIRLLNQHAEYFYSIRLDPLGGENAGVFGEAGDPNLGKFSTPQWTPGDEPMTLSFSISRIDPNAKSTGYELQVTGTAENGTELFRASQGSDVKPLKATKIDGITFAFTGHPWKVERAVGIPYTMTLRDFTITTNSTGSD